MMINCIIFNKSPKKSRKSERGSKYQTITDNEMKDKEVKRWQKANWKSKPMK